MEPEVESYAYLICYEIKHRKMATMDHSASIYELSLDQTEMNLQAIKLALIPFLVKQLDLVSPGDSRSQDQAILTEFLPSALQAFRPISRAVKCFKNDTFNLINSLQYATFLYLLSSKLSEAGQKYFYLADRIFLLNKALHGVELYHKTKLPPVFFISHGIGSVLGDAHYANNLIFFQNITVGRVGENRPILGSQVIVYPNASITGKSRIGDNCVISAGVHLHNQTVPDNTIVKITEGQIAFTENKGNLITQYLDLSVPDKIDDLL